jgi:hypothetical protein
VVKSPSLNAYDQHVLRDLDSDVLQRSPTTPLSCRYGEFEATIDIGTLAIMEGQLPGWALNLVHEWGMIHREELLEAWRFCRENRPPAKIEPLT